MASFLMIPVSTVYDEYIDRQKLTEQKKPIWVYSSSPPQEGSEQQRWLTGNWRKSIRH